MTYFQYTGQDLAKQRAAGIEETRREIGEEVLALIDDTARKMNGETATDPDAEREYDRGYLMEDLLTRVANYFGRYVPEAETLFPAVMDGRRAVAAYPLLIEEQEPERIAEITQELPTRTGNPALLSGVAEYRGRAVGTVDHKTIRETHNLTTFDGITRHPFEASPESSGMACTRMVLRDGYGDACGKSADNAVHDWMW